MNYSETPKILELEPSPPISNFRFGGEQCGWGHKLYWPAKPFYVICVRLKTSCIKGTSVRRQKNAFVTYTSHLDYCNSLLYKLTQWQYDRLQKVRNAAVRVTCLIPKFAQIAPVLRELHWLHRVDFNIALLVFKTLSDLLVVKPRTRYSLRSDMKHCL